MSDFGRTPPADKYLFGWAVFGAVFALYALTNFDGVPLLDDGSYISENDAVVSFDPSSSESWARAAFSSPSQIRPIPLLSFAIQWRLTEGSLVGMHVVNDLLHAAAAAVLFYLLLDFFGIHLPDRLEASNRLRLAAAGALLWGLHPIQTSAVTYLSQRITVMCALFGLSACCLYLRARRTRESKYYFVAAVSYLFALASKEIAAVLPVAVGLYEWILGSEESREARRRRWACLAAALIPPLAIGAAYLMVGLESPAKVGIPDLGFTLTQRLLSAGRMYWRYLGLLLFPVHQAADYGIRASSGLLSPWNTAPALCLLGATIASAVLLRRRYPISAFCALAFVVLLAPETTVLMLHLFFEHRLYLPGAVVLPAVAAALWLRLREGAAGARGADAALAALVVLYGALAGIRNRDYSDFLRLWAGNVAVQPDAELGRASLARFLAQEGRSDESVEILQEGARRLPRSYLLHNELGQALEAMGRFEEALGAYRHAQSVRPEDASIRLNYARALYRSGERERGVAEAKAAVRAEGSDSEQSRELGLWFFEQGEFPAAIDELKQALRVNANDSVARYALGVSYENLGAAAEAAEHYETACRSEQKNACERLGRLPLKTKSLVP